MTGPETEDGEILEPIPLSGSPGTAAAPSSGFRGGLLMLLLAVWTLGVYGFFSRRAEDHAESTPPVIGEENREEETARKETPPDAERTAEQSPTPVQEAKKPDLVRFVSEPSAAAVLVDGLFIGMTPLEMERPRPEQRVTFRKSGYEPVQVSGEARETESGIRVALRPITGRVRISLTPSQATLWMDGRQLEVPENGVLDLPMRPLRIKATAPGYETREIDVLPATAYEREIQIELKAVRSEQ